ncbi:MAG: restriction endonuclease subunit S [Sarcina sp.]
MAKKQMTLEEKLEEAIVKEEPYEIPDNWIWSNIGSVSFEIKNGTTIKQNKGETGVKVTRIESLQNNSIDLNRLGTVMDEAKVKEQDYYVDGDIALSHINSIEHVGKTALIDDSLLPLVHGMNLLRIRFNKELILPEYFQFYTRGYDYKKFVVERVNRAVNQVSLNQKNLSSVPIPFPPLNEQQRIVDKIESLFEKLDKAKELIDEARDEFENRKAAILEKAFSDNLISNDEKWESIKLDFVVKSIEAGKSFKCVERPAMKNEVGLVKISAVTWGEFLVNENKIVEDINRINENYFIKKGDFLISRANTIELVGSSVVVSEIDQDIMLSDKVWRVNFDESLINKYFLNYYLKSIHGRKAIEERSTGSQLSMRNISQKSFRDIEINIPSINTQNMIVEKLDILLNFENRAKKSIAIVEKIELIKKSILAKAFRGELGTNNPEEESAIELLKEILSEK